MKVIVKHMEMNSETGAVEGYTPVAVVDVPKEHASVRIAALEYAWRYTNNVMGSC